MDWKTVLSQAGYRLSEPRKRVHQILESTDQPLTPLQIYQEFEKGGYLPGLISVYRTLELLTQLGIAVRVYTSDGNVGYLAASLGHHHHILCQNCHRAVEFDGSEDLGAWFSQVEKQTGFVVNDHLLQLYGICPDCREKQGT